MTAQEYLSSYGIALEVARDFLFSNLNNLQLIYDTCLYFGINNDMIAEILVDDFT